MPQLHLMFVQVLFTHMKYAKQTGKGYNFFSIIQSAVDTISFEEKTREITGGKKEKKYENEEKTNVFKSNLLLPFEYYFIQSQSWSRGA